jgi:hypothetical protein
LTLPFITYGWNTRIFGIIASAYFSGIILEDFLWFVVNPDVKMKEFWTKFTDYYPWIKIRDKKILPLSYILGILIAILFWWFLWR